MTTAVAVAAAQAQASVDPAGSSIPEPDIAAALTAVCQVATNALEVSVLLLWVAERGTGLEFVAMYTLECQSSCTPWCELVVQRLPIDVIGRGLQSLRSVFTTLLTGFVAINLPVLPSPRLVAPSLWLGLKGV